VKSLAIIGPDGLQKATVAPVRSGSIGCSVVRASRWSALDDPAFVGAVCDLEGLADLTNAPEAASTWVIVLHPSADVELLSLIEAHPQVVGLVQTTDDLAPVRPWELTYLVRRLVASSEPSPLTSELLAWGASTVSWRPSTTQQLHTAVHQVEQLAKRLGCTRRQIALTSSAAHELLMNAVYDAPVDPSGQPLHAHDRRAEVQLAPHHVPTLALTASGDYIALDVLDPNGRLSRSRFLRGVLRGLRNANRDTIEFDRSHGGAGLGMATLFQSSVVLRAEVTPRQRTHVSWVHDRRERSMPSHTGSLVFVPQVPHDPLELAPDDLGPYRTAESTQRASP
jgi:hypothetical protein